MNIKKCIENKNLYFKVLRRPEKGIDEQAGIFSIVYNQHIIKIGGFTMYAWEAIQKILDYIEEKFPLSRRASVNRPE